MKLVLDITTESQKDDIMRLAKRSHVPIEVLEMTEDEEDAALIRAIHAGAQNDFLSSEEKEAFLARLAK